MRIINRVYLYILSLFLLLPGISLAALPDDFEANYKVSKSILTIGHMEVTLQRDKKGNPVYGSVTEAGGLVSIFRRDRITEQSNIELTPGGFRPTRFVHIHKGSKKNRDEDIRFDWAKYEASNSISGKEWKQKIHDGVVDNLTIQLSLMSDLQEGKKPLEYTVVDKGELKSFRFEIVGRETVEVPAGKFETIKLKRTRKDSRRITYMWTAPSLHYLPVKLQHVEPDSSNFVMELQSLAGKITRGKKYPADD